MFRQLRQLALVGGLITASSAQAVIIDFVDLIENGGFGESGWNSLGIDLGGGNTMTISATDGGNAAFAYLDWNHAGLGVCGSVSASNQDKKRPGNSGNVCNPASDDNVTTGEVLSFMFNADVMIEKIWLNNTHDPNPSGEIKAETVLVNGASTVVPGNGYAPGNGYNSQANLNASANNFIGSYAVGAGSAFTLGFGGAIPEQFYVSAMEITTSGGPGEVPIPGTLLLIGAGILGLRFGRRPAASH